MESSKSVLKSTSSNTAMVETPSQNASNTKSKSNARIKATADLKKRGVYVESKYLKPLLANVHNEHTNIVEQDKKRRNTKQTTSIAEILNTSPATASTQFKKGGKSTEAISTEQIPDEVQYCSENKKIYESKVFKGAKDMKNETEDVMSSNRSIFFVKRLTQASSNYSEDGHIRSDYFSNLDKNEKDKQIALLNDGRIIDGDPLTLVAEEKERQKSNDDYNIFFDLLRKSDVESTLHASSKISFEIEEAVAKKLQIQKSQDEIKMDVCERPSIYEYNIHEEETWTKKHYIPSSRPKSAYNERVSAANTFPSSLFTKKKYRQKSITNQAQGQNKLSTNAFLLPRHTLYRKDSTSTSQSATFSRKGSKTKNKKKNLLNILKEQLSTETETYEEPQNLFEALQVMARNKRRNKNKIHFAHQIMHTADDFNDPGCTLKRHKIFSRTQGKKKHTIKGDKENEAYWAPILSASVASIKLPEINSFTRPDLPVEFENQSSHSLEVYDDELESQILYAISNPPGSTRRQIIYTSPQSNKNYSKD